MKVSTTVLIISAFLFFQFNNQLVAQTHPSGGQAYGWTDLSSNLPELGNFNDVYFIGEEGWITGGNDKVYYTSDGGETFSIQNLPPLPGNEGITSSIFMKNSQEGYVVTYSGEINKTDDGGINWYLLHDPGGVINSVHFPPNSNTGFTCGGNGTVWSFDDTSINDMSPPSNASNLQSICCPVDATDVKVCGETTIARFLNNSWANPQFYDSSLSYNSIFFINNTVGWAGGTNGTIILTTDGIHWIIQTTNTHKNINDIFFLHSQEGWAAGTEVLLRSIDGGITWNLEDTLLTSGKELRAVYFTSPNNGYVVGNYTFLKYGEITSVENEEELPTEFTLSQSYPNPFNNTSIIRYSISQSTNVVIKVFDVLGSEIEILVNEEKDVGTYELTWNAEQLPSGIYFYQIQAGVFVETKKMVLLR